MSSNLVKTRLMINVDKLNTPLTPERHHPIDRDHSSPEGPKRTLLYCVTVTDPSGPQTTGMQCLPNS